jgi:hypothetical protein
MLTVHKYEIPIIDDFSIPMPDGAKVLCVQVQRGIPVMWARVDVPAPMEARRFRLIGTGNPADETGRYVGTFQTHGGALVFHLFEAV